MSNVNRGKQFEEVIRKSFEKVPNTNVERMADPVQGYLGIRNHSDFIVYHKPYEYHIECKSTNNATLSINSNDSLKKYGAITNNQWNGLLEVSQINGIIAGVIIWFVKYDITKFISISELVKLKAGGIKSIRFDDDVGFNLVGIKKRIFFDYDMSDFFKHIF